MRATCSGGQCERTLQETKTVRNALVFAVCVFMAFVPQFAVSQDPQPGRKPAAEEIDAVTLFEVAADEVVDFNRKALRDLADALAETAQKLREENEKFEKAAAGTRENDAALAAFVASFGGLRRTTEEFLAEAKELEEEFILLIIPDLEREAKAISAALKDLKEDGPKALTLKLRGLVVDAALVSAHAVRGSLKSGQNSFSEVHGLAARFLEFGEKWKQVNEGKDPAVAREMLLKIFAGAVEIFDRFPKAK